MSDSSETAIYRQVIGDFCARMDLSDQEAVAQGASIAIEGVQMAITLNQLVPRAPAVSIYVDVGLPPRGGEASVLRMLLQQNFNNSSSRGLTYCISPATGHVVGAIHVGLGGLEGQGLEAMVNMLVDVSLEFRETYFLWDRSAAPQVRAGGATPGSLC
ncbi:MAG: CesT family type III secretion system chaperone [Hydrogenophaga sp.]|uniref:CesT family type III secretion system chaperone n=1 Tax=Hydrogenophaga sp. TaxID=1904254 RepID=UPI003D0AFE69